jgi:hypothetical protein
MAILLPVKDAGKNKSSVQFCYASCATQDILAYNRKEGVWSRSKGLGAILKMSQMMGISELTINLQRYW